MLSDFDILEKLGSGSFGKVMLVKSKHDQHQYAIKYVRLLKSRGGYEKAVSEVVMMAKLSHPHVVRYHTCWVEQVEYEEESEDSDKISEDCEENSEDCEEQESEDSDKISEDCEENLEDCEEQKAMSEEERSNKDLEKIQKDGGSLLVDTLLIQLELCSGTLAERMMKKALSHEEVWGIFRQLVTGLEYLHTKDIRHGDLTPSNIFFNDNNILKIGDFGFSTNPAKGSLGWVEFAPGNLYCAPELDKAKRRYSPASDIYSLGLILLEMFVVNDEVRGDALKQYLDEHTFHHCLDLISQKTKNIITDMTKSNPRKRPSASDLLAQEPWV